MRPTDARVLLHHVRRARSALAQGVDDPELTQDLTAFRRPPIHLHEHTIVAPLGGLPTRPTHRADGRDGYRDGFHADDEAPRDRPDVPWWRSVPVIAGAVLVLLAAAVAGCWLGAVGPFTRVPAVVGVPEGQLIGLGESAGVEFVVAQRRFDERVPKGQVLRADPVSDERTFRGGTVEVWVSRGPERHAVPALAGMNEERARALLADAQLRIASVRRIFSDKVGEGRVISSSPPPGTRLRRNALVSLVMSKGPEPVAIPSVVGAPLDQAKATLEPLGLIVTTTEEFSDTVPAGAVISQDPAPSQGHRGDGVRLVLSKGPEYIPLPDVVRRGVDEAKKMLTDAGFQVEVRNSQVYVGMNVVIAQTPAAGQPTKVGTVIVLDLVRADLRRTGRPPV